jgi:hypothetical protein
MKFAGLSQRHGHLEMGANSRRIVAARDDDAGDGGMA